MYYEIMDAAFISFASKVKEKLSDSGLKVDLTTIHPVSANSSILLDVNDMKMHITTDGSWPVLEFIYTNQVPKNVQVSYHSIDNFINDLKVNHPYLFSKKLNTVHDKTQLFEAKKHTLLQTKKENK